MSESTPASGATRNEGEMFASGASRRRWWHIHRMHRMDLYAIGPGTRYGHHATEERQCRCGLTERRRVRIPLAPTPPTVKR